jgi:hypothetical protein
MLRRSERHDQTQGSYRSPSDPPGKGQARKLEMVALSAEHPASANVLPAEVVRKERDKV